MRTPLLRHKKRTNSRTLTIRTQWGKANDPAYINDPMTGKPFEEWFFTPLKSNPNTTVGFYIPTNPYPDAINYDGDDCEPLKFDEDEISYLQSLWLNEDTIDLFDDDEVII